MDDAVVEHLPPDEAFELLAHETRFRTLRTLNEADGALAFTELRERVGVDDPGQFNYHLGKLCGQFVREKDAGYALAAAGARVVGAVLSGGLTKEIDADRIPLDDECSRCDAPLSVRFDADRVFVRCPDCGFNVLHLDVPAGVVEDWPREGVPGVVDRWLKRFVTSLDYGICHNCDGRLDTRVLPAGSDDAPDWVAEHDYAAAVTYDCRRCGGNWQMSVSAAVALRPAVVAFHHDHGVNVRKTPEWSLDWLATTTATVTSDDPLRVEVPVSLDDETLALTVDADLNVVAERRE